MKIIWKEMKVIKNKWKNRIIIKYENHLKRHENHKRKSYGKNQNHKKYEKSYEHKWQIIKENHLKKKTWYLFFKIWKSNEKEWQSQKKIIWKTWNSWEHMKIIWKEIKTIKENHMNNIKKHKNIWKYFEKMKIITENHMGNMKS